MESRGARLVSLAKRKLNFESPPSKIASKFPKSMADYDPPRREPSTEVTETPCNIQRTEVAPDLYNSGPGADFSGTTLIPGNEEYTEHIKVTEKKSNSETIGDSSGLTLTLHSIEQAENIEADLNKSDSGPDGDFSGTDSDEFKPPASSSSSSSDDNSSSSSSSSSDDDDESRVEATTLPPKALDPGTSREMTNQTGQNIDGRSQPKIGKRRSRNPNKWKRNVTKQLKNTGQSYTSRTGKSVGAKTMGATCTQKCRLTCSQKYTEDERKHIFETYWQLGDLQRQRDYLSSCIKPLAVCYRRIRVDGKNATPRNPNTAYYITHEGTEKRVCKVFLLNTLNIAERTLRTVIKAKNANLGSVPQDNRGRHNNHSALPQEVKQSVIDHINSVPRIESHYLRAQTTREYIDGGLTVSEMHRNYDNLRKENHLPAAPYPSYLHIFNTQFNIGFFMPKKDQCDICVGYKNAPVDMKPVLEADYKLHLEEKSFSRIEKRSDMDKSLNCDNLNVSTYDLQAVLPCPVGDSSAFFYKTRLNCYNFTITNGRNEHTTCYFWHEGLAHRGAIEIGSCVFKYLEDLATKKPDSDVIFYSDNCCGQQKNKYILAMYYYAVMKLNIKSITHKFLIRGHTQNEGDTAHSIIERCIKKERKSGPIYVPDQYISAIRKAKKSGKPFTVHEMNYDDFFELKSLSDKINLNTSKNITGGAIKLSEIKMVRFMKNEDTYEYKTSYKNEILFKAKLFLEQTRNTRRVGRSNQLFSVQEILLEPAYTSKIPIAERKKQDIMQLIEKNIVPHYYAEFYKNL